ncbi:hypothetical protein CPB86DRAFT_563048 [Serendipita vermifera]|nr:hypothetical protein CPB86DRAFT_563048 [Serendipita vermifera]
MDIVMRRFQITCPRGNQDHLIRRSGRVRTQPQDVGLSPPPTHGLTDLVAFPSRPSNNILSHLPIMFLSASAGTSKTNTVDLYCLFRPLAYFASCDLRSEPSRPPCHNCSLESQHP